MSDNWYRVAPDHHFWCQHRNELLRQFVLCFGRDQGQLLDVGCGHGVVLRNVSQQLRMQADGLELNAAAIAQIGSQDCRTVYVLDILKDADKLDRHYDVVVLFDVLEHIADDADFLTTALRFAKPRGLVLVNLPAGEWLCSRFDDKTGHLRSYDQRMLKALVEKAGLELLAIQYWGITYVPLLLLRKVWMKFQSQENLVDQGLDEGTGLKRLLLNLLSAVDRVFLWKPFGTSLILAARKP